MLSKLEQLEDEASKEKINIYYKNISLDGFCIKDNICINKAMCNTKKYWVLEHEYTHLKLGALYTLESKDIYIKKQERKVNDFIIKKHKLDQEVLACLKRGCDKDEICFGLNLPYEVFDATIDYMYRKGILHYEIY